MDRRIITLEVALAWLLLIVVLVLPFPVFYNESPDLTKCQPLSTSQATAGSRCCDERPRQQRDQYRRLRDDRVLVRKSGSPGRAFAGQTLRPRNHALDQCAP